MDALGIPASLGVRRATLVRMFADDGAVEARLRAMPQSRMVDYGMDPGDARRLREEAAAGVPWHVAARTIADEQDALRQAALDVQDAEAALAAARCAVAAGAFAHMADNHDTALKRDMFALYAADVAAYTELLGMRRLEVPYEEGTLVGWSLAPAARPVGTVVMWGGLSGWGAVYARTAQTMVEHGLACLLVEGPGQGESRIVHGVVADERLTEGFGRFVDVALDDPQCGGPVGVMGSSFGGLFAADLAAVDPRVSACVVNGGLWNPEVPAFRMPREQLEAAFGTEDPARITAVLRSLWLDDSAVPIACPVLVLHGGQDPLVSLADAEAFARCSARGEVRHWPDGEHTLYNYGPERDAVAARWLRRVLTAA